MDATAAAAGGASTGPTWSSIDTLILLDRYGTRNGDVLSPLCTLRGCVCVCLFVSREVDLFSALLTPLTYEGLIDEVLGIENGRVRIDASLLSDEKDQVPRTKRHLHIYIYTCTKTLCALI